MPESQTEFLRSLSPADAELLRDLRGEWHAASEHALKPIAARVESLEAKTRHLLERSSRGPGAASLPFDTASISLARQLSDDMSFQQFIKSVRTPNSSFGAELRLPPLSRKAATPVSGISPTEHVGLIYGPAQIPLRLKAVLPTIPVASGSIEYSQETSFTPSAAIVPETTLKPSMAITFALKTAKVSTIAQVVKASVQALADLPQLQNWLDNRLSYSCLLKEEDVLINGDAPNSIQGLLAIAPTFTYSPATSDNGMDVIGHAIGQLTGQGYGVDCVVLNAANYTNMRLLKNTQGSYLFMGGGALGPDDESITEANPLLWQVPLVLSPSMPVGKYLVGAFRQSTLLFSRETLTLTIATQNEDDFVKNLICLRGELRSGLAVPVPAGLLQGTLPAGSLMEAPPTHGKK